MAKVRRGRDNPRQLASLGEGAHIFGRGRIAWGAHPKALTCLERRWSESGKGVTGCRAELAGEFDPA